MPQYFTHCNMTINSTDQETVMFCKNFTAFGLIQKKIPSLSVSISFQIRDAGASSAVDIATSGITSPAAHLGGPSTAVAYISSCLEELCESISITVVNGVSKVTQVRPMNLN